MDRSQRGLLAVAVVAIAGALVWAGISQRSTASTLAPSKAKSPGQSATSTATHPASSVAAAQASALASGSAAARLNPSGHKVPCPSNMVALSARVCIDRYEAHLLDADTGGVHPHDRVPDPARPYRAAVAAGVFPQGYVSRRQAAVACKRAAKRLCSLAEWQSACLGKRHWKYPYGNKEKSGLCNNGKAHLLEKLFGRDPAAWTYDGALNSPKLAREPGFLSKTGTYKECKTEDGVHDMVGNLHEWVSTPADVATVSKLRRMPFYRRKQPWHPKNGIFVGGFYSNRNELGPGCHYVTFAHRPSYHDYSTGFRCCSDRPKTRTATQ
jgi:formylglycine-generating enzyme